MRRKGERFAALVIYNEPDIRDVRAIAGKAVQKAFKTKQYVNIREMMYSTALDIFIAIVPLPEKREEHKG